MTHCNAGALATGGYGTALGVIRAAIEGGNPVAVMANETRPFMQGARLTVWELQQDDIPVTLLTDNMASASIHADDIRAKMRQTGITRREDPAYVVLESSGDVSVIGRDSEVEDWLMEDVSKDPTREVDRS